MTYELQVAEREAEILRQAKPRRAEPSRRRGPRAFGGRVVNISSTVQAALVGLGTKRRHAKKLV